MDLPGILRDRYGITHADVEPHDAGMSSRTWWVSVDDARCYVATWVADGAVGSLAAGVQAAAIAEHSGVATGAAVQALGGDRVLLVEGGSLVLVHHLDGLPMGDHDSALVGRTLARVHHATVGHELALGLRWPSVEPDGPHLASYPDLRGAVVEAVDAVRSLPRLVHGIAHGDPAPEAFLRLPGHEVALVDWTGALVAPLLYDVASAAMYLGGLDAAEPMLTAYAAGEGPATPDLPHAATMLRLRWAVQADCVARRLATRDLTGTDDTGDTDDADDARGLDDARRHLLGVRDGA
ncbi:phosphotransferase [Nocardioides rubriscoriae]|uniref:phosphotransferase n=1 Tax=Nocardioides rubriscoriae TaxID=642762 RepID=UPI0011DF144C|nr:phosphotransferase [Nocardioides rubriscoriae]